MFLNGGIDGNGTRPFLTDFFGDDIHYTAERIGTVQRRHRATDHFNTFDGIDRDPVQIEIIVAEDGIAGVNAFTVDKNQGVAAVQTTNTYALTVIPFVRQLYARHFFEDILQILYRFSLQVFLGNDADTGGCIFKVLFNGRCSDNHRFAIIIDR